MCYTTDCCCIELASWWIAVVCLLIESTILNHTITTQQTVTSCPNDDNYVIWWKWNWYDQSVGRQNSLLSLVIFFIDNATEVPCTVVKATFAHYNITLLFSASVKILQNYRRSAWCNKLSNKCFERLLMLKANMKA